jgi:hypothetical protein
VGHLRALTLMHIGASTREAKAPFREEIEKKEIDFKAVLERYEHTITTAEDRETFKTIGPLFASYLESIHKGLDLSDAMNTREAHDAYVSEARPRVLKLIQAINAEVDFNKANSDRNAAAAVASINNAVSWIWGILAVSLISGVGLMFTIVRRLNGALRRTADELSRGSDQVISAAAQIASSSQALAQGASELAASLEETSSASNRSTGWPTRIRRTPARRPAWSRNRSRSSRRRTKTGTDGGAMEEIGSSNDSVKKTIRIIDEIAFQTIILALNAAAEPHGQAGGMVSLWWPTKCATWRGVPRRPETQHPDYDSVAKSREGKVKVETLQSNPRRHRGGRQREDPGAQVCTGSEEQTRGIEQVAKAIVQMEHVTQQTAASAESGVQPRS